MGSETDEGRPGETGGIQPYCGPYRDRLQRLGQSYTVTELAADQSGTKEYHFNSLGFRGDEYDPNAAFTAFVFGESIAFGSGLNLDETWCWRLVANLTEREGIDPDQVCFLNFADSGSSNAAIARSVIQQCASVRPDLVIVNFANYRRSETFIDGFPFQVQPTHVDPEVGTRLSGTGARARELVQRSKHFYSFATSTRCVSESLQAILLVQTFCELHGVRAIACCNHYPEISADWVWESEHVGPMRRAVDPAFLASVCIGDFQLEDIAADGAHAGPPTHDRFAEMMLRFHDGLPVGSANPGSRTTGAAVTSTVRAFYAEMPFNYHETVEEAAASVRNDLVAATYPDLHELLRDGGVRRVAEFGCGAGSLACSLALHYGLEVVAVDLTQQAVDRAEAVAKELGVADRIEFLCTDLFDVVPSPPVDVALSLGVLHHTRDAELAFQHVCRSVRPGGHVYVGLYHEPGRSVFLELARKVLREQGKEAAFQAYRSLEGVQHLGDVHARSWFRDQVLHPHETLHTLRQTYGWLEDAEMDLVSTSINRFQSFGSLDELFDLEPGYADRAHKALIEERRYFPGFFTFLAKDRRASAPSAAQ